MIAFEVRCNGEKLCVAGVGDHGVLTQGMSWVNGRSADRPHNAQSRLPHLHIGGIMNDEHVDWLENPFNVKVGDELIVRVVEVENVDQPMRRYAKENQAERRSAWKRELANVRSLLRSPLIEVGYLTSNKAFDEGLAQDELEVAVVVLGALGELNQGSLEFWEGLCSLAEQLSMYDRAGKFRRKLKELSSSQHAHQHKNEEK